MDRHPRTRQHFRQLLLAPFPLLIALLACSAAVAATECQTANPTSEYVDGQPLTITFFGVSTLMFDDGQDRILVDGFFSRPGVLRTLFGSVEPVLSRIVEGLGASPPRVRALLVAHAHHDHALDVAAVAGIEKHAVVIGTPSVIALALAQDISRERLCLASAVEQLDFGGFAIRAVDSRHGPTLPVIGPLIDRELTRAPENAAHFTRFTDNENLSFFITHGDHRRILVHPSAGESDMSAFAADIVFLGMGRVGTMSNSEADAYIASVVGRDAELVVPIHWDAFTTAPEQPLRHSPWPLDSVEAGFDHLCRFAATRSGIDVMKPQMRSALVVQPDGSRRWEGQWTRLCEQAHPTH